MRTKLLETTEQVSSDPIMESAEVSGTVIRLISAPSSDTIDRQAPGERLPAAPAREIV